MGWSYGYEPRNVLVERLVKGAVAHKTTNVGRHLWCVFRLDTAYGDHPPGTPIIVLHLLESRKENGEDYSGYKTISEEMGPCYYDCPLDLLDQAIELDPQWRVKVREYHESRRQDFVVGEAVTVFGRPYTIVGRDKRSWLIRAPGGGVFKTTAPNIKRAGPRPGETEVQS